MRFHKIILHNFGIYADTNVLDLSGEKPIYLIGGMNGRGKTTLLEAVLLGLYGRRSTAVLESKLSYSKYLSNLINNSNREKTTYIELEFELEDKNIMELYKIKREWSLGNGSNLDKILVEKDNNYDEFLSENWDMFIEDILPSAIAPFFFFDGEKISDLANSNDDELMKDSIKQLLGIDIVEQAIADVDRVAAQRQKTIKVEINKTDLQEIEKSIDEIEYKLKKVYNLMGDYEVEKVKVKNKISLAENDFSKFGGSLSYSKIDLEERIDKIQNKIGDVNKDFIELASGDLPLIMVRSLLKEIESTALEEKKQSELQIIISRLPEFVDKFNRQHDTEKDFDELVNFISLSLPKEEVIYNLSEKSFYKIEMLLNSAVRNFKKDIINIYEKKKILHEQKQQVENYLSVNINEEALEEKHQEIIALYTQKALLEEKYTQAENEFYTLKKELALHEKRKLKLANHAVNQLENTDDSKRVILYVEKVKLVLDHYKKQLQADKVEQLSQTMVECFRKIANKTDLISKIIIDNETLDFNYLNKSNEKIEKATLSAGEKQLLVIAMLWALRLCSKRNLPIIIDTPLARLDNTHREALIKNYFPWVSEQTILLSTDSEVYDKNYELLVPYIEKEYTLYYDEELARTIVKNGYFRGEDHVFKTS